MELFQQFYGTLIKCVLSGPIGLKSSTSITALRVLQGQDCPGIIHYGTVIIEIDV